MNMKNFELNDSNVVVVIGSGAGGGTLANELAQKGIDVVLLEAGAQQSDKSFVQDEWASFGQLSWGDTRTTSGSWRVAKDFPNLPAWICKTVGGTTSHWAGASLRIQEHEFKAKTTYGAIEGANLLDWPISLKDVEPYYQKAENKMGVTRTNNIDGLPGNNNFKVMNAGAKKLGYKEVSTGHMAVNSKPRDGRSSCLQMGFCFQGCKVKAKWSTLYTEIPAGISTGRMELRTQAHVQKIEHDENNKVTAVIYIDADGNTQKQSARAVCIAANALETPRLLLLSDSNKYKTGLANSSDLVGKNYMRHMTGSVYGMFEKPVKMYRGTTMAGIIQDEAKYDPKRGFVGGYEMETISLGPAFMAAFLDPQTWGEKFGKWMDAYENLAGMWLVGEDLPQLTNRVTLNNKVKDQFGAPVVNVNYDDHKNDIAMRKHAFTQGSKVYEAAGAIDTYHTPPYPSTHNLGTCRMSAKPEDGVVNSFGQTHDIVNLFISDGSQFTTSAAENPTLTIVSLAIRQADYIAKQMKEKLV